MVYNEGILPGRGTTKGGRNVGTKKTMPELAAIGMNKMPELCGAQGCTVSFDIPGTGNTARMTVIPKDVHAPSDEKWQFEVGVHAQGSDRLYSHYLFSGTKAEVLAWVATEAAQKNVIQSVRELSDRVDKD